MEEIKVDFSKVDFEKIRTLLYGMLDGFEEGPYYEETKEEYRERHKEYYGYYPEELELIIKYMRNNNLT